MARTPGALAEVLDVFKENGINLTDIEKRPSKKVNWEYYFFIDAQGHELESARVVGYQDAKRFTTSLGAAGL